MKATCTNNPNHDRFVTVAHVTEDWIVDSAGDFQEVAADNDTQVTHGPNPGNTWTCHVCGAEASVQEES